MHGKPGRRGYHNEEWARKMDELGLTPSSTGEPGGDRVGYRMSHYIVEDGAFARAFEAMPREYLLPWTCWEPQGGNKGKAKPRVEAQVHLSDVRGQRVGEAGAPSSLRGV